MSMANRATTKAEEAILQANGFYQSPFESMADTTVVDGEYLYCGNWYHSEQPAGVTHFGPDEALAFLASRRQEFAKNS
jgi:hypothetical protein